MECSDENCPSESSVKPALIIVIDDSRGRESGGVETCACLVSLIDGLISFSRRRASISSNSIWRVGSDTGASGGVGSCVADVETTGVGVSGSGVRTSGRGDSGDSGDSSSSSGSSLRFVRFAAGRTTFCKHRFLRLSYLKMACCLHHPDSIGINSCI